MPTWDGPEPVDSSPLEASGFSDQSDGRVAVLLGAGASADADVPLTGALTAKVIDAVKDAHPTLSGALNYVCSSLVGHAGTKGVSPYAPLNIERVVSSLRLLSGRATHEAAPFVTWSAAAEEFDQHTVDPRQSTAFMNAVTGRLAGLPSNLEEPIVEMVWSVMRAGTGAVYAQLDEVVINVVAEILSDCGSVEYLSPLAELAGSQRDGLDIATLNYDLTVETMCSQQGIDVSRGFIQSADDGLAWPDHGLRLYKLHGSVDWRRVPIGGTRRATGDHGRYVEGQRIALASDENSQFAPAIVLGDRDKVGSGGLTIALLAAFEAALRRADGLVVVGYSFSDDHINDMITRWINGNQQRELIILDRYWSAPPKSFRASLSSGLCRSESWRGHDPIPPRMVVISDRTQAGSSQAPGT